MRKRNIFRIVFAITLLVALLFTSIIIPPNTIGAATLPSVETRPATSISNTAAMLNARIVSNGGSDIIERRFSWGKTPSCSDGWTSVVGVSGDYFAYYLSGLNPSNIYYFQAWAKNSIGWANGAAIPFTTQGTALQFNSLTPSTITRSDPTYDANLSASGANFYNVNRVTFTWSGPDSDTDIWDKGDSDWNSKVTLISDSQMTLRPRVLYNESGTQPQTWTWTVTLRDTTGATASRSFTVTYIPPQTPTPTPTPSNATNGIDTATDVSGIVDCLRGKGILFVGRYFSTYDWKVIKKEEAQKISGADIYIVSIWQESANYPEYFSYNQGKSDGKNAFKYSAEIGQTPNTPVYFAVDFDATSEHKQRILDYFRGVKDGYGEYLKEYGINYKIGVYGSYWVLNWLKEQGIATYFYQAYASGWSGGENNNPWPDYDIRQVTTPQTLCGIEVDHDDASSEFGGWRFTTGQASVAKLVITSPLEITPQKASYCVQEIITAKFTIENEGTVPITFDVLTVGGRDPDGKVVDFDPEESITLNSNASINYIGDLRLPEKPGTYHFFCAYYIENPTPEEKKLLDENNWNTTIELGEGLTDEDRPKDINVNDCPILQPVPDKARGGIIIPREMFPEGNGAYIPIHVPDVTDDSNVIKEDSHWKTIKEIKETKVDFDWAKLIASFGAEGGDAPGVAAVGVMAGIFRAVHEAISVVDLKITIQTNSEENLRAIIQMGDPNSTSFMRSYAGEGYVDMAAESFWMIRAAFSESIAEVLDLEPDDFPSVYYTMVLKIDRSHKNDEYIGYISFSQDNKIVLTPKIYPEDELKILRIHEIIIPWKLETIIDLTGSGFISLTESTLDDVGSKTILEMLAPIYSMYESGIIIQEKSPGELRVYDSLGRVTGLVNAEIREEIPDSFYYDKSKAVVIFSPTDSYRYEIAGTSEGNYGIEVTSVQSEATSTFTLMDVSTSTGTVHQYTIDWDALSQGGKGVTMKIDSDGDGTFEETRYMSATSEQRIPTWVWIAIGAVVTLVALTLGIIVRNAKMKPASQVEKNEEQKKGKPDS